MPHDLTNFSNEEHLSGAAAFIIPFSFWCEMSRITENSESVDFVAESDLLNFYES